MSMIAITGKSIDVGEVCRSVRSEGAGGVVHFIGTVRQDGGVKGLEYEAYVSMAQKKLEVLAEDAKKKWNLEKVSIVHRIGWVPLGEEAVIVAVSSPHRAEAFEACRVIMDTLKRDVPIWKKGGEECCSHEQAV